MLTENDVREGLIRLATDMPDAVNPVDPEGTGCVYTGQDGSHCIAGQFLADAGLPVPDYGDFLNYDTSVESLLMLKGIEHDASAASLLAAAQYCADAGMKWGDAVAIALDFRAAHPGKVTWRDHIAYKRELEALDSSSES